MVSQRVNYGHMLENIVRGKSLAAVASSIADGFIYLNPLVLKDFPTDIYKELHNKMSKLQTQIRTEVFPSHDQTAIRNRNMRLQRLHQAIVVLQNSARVKKVIL